MGRSAANGQRLLELLEGNPIVGLAFVAERLGIARTIASNLVKDFCGVVHLSSFVDTSNADAIFFIDQGKVLAHGTHEELMETCDEYRELYQAEQIEAAY